MARATTVLLLVDFLNFMDFDSAKLLAPHALRAARRARGLKRRMARSRVPVIYANDNFGHWESDIHAIVETCIARGGASRKLAEHMARVLKASTVPSKTPTNVAFKPSAD